MAVAACWVRGRSRGVEQGIPLGVCGVSMSLVLGERVLLHVGEASVESEWCFLPSISKVGGGGGGSCPGTSRR